jgi:HAD superfamily hydrolase (TIGR01509 family)
MQDARTHPYDLIIFDCDGVLVDSELLSGQAVIDCLLQHGIKVDLDTVFDKLLGQSPVAIAEHCAQSGRSLPDDFYAQLQTSLRATFAVALKPIAGAASVLKYLRIPYCVASSSDLDRIEHSLHVCGLSNLVDGRLFSAEMVRRGKPAPDLFLHAAAGMGAAPERTLVIEDSVSGVRAGRAAGMTVWGFVGGSHYAGRDGQTLLTTAGADRVFDRMDDFDRCEARLLDHVLR